MTTVDEDFEAVPAIVAVEPAGAVETAGDAETTAGAEAADGPLAAGPAAAAAGGVAETAAPETANAASAESGSDSDSEFESESGSGSGSGSRSGYWSESESAAATIAADAAAPEASAFEPAAPTPPIPTPRVYRFELAKLFAPWRTRLLILACLLLPALAVIAIDQQTTLPSDTLFGRRLHTSAWAGPLVVLGFAGTWALPLLTSLVAGDVFAVEDRLGTWRHLLVTVRSARRVFTAKALAGGTVIVLMVLALAVSGIAGGLIAVGGRPLIGLDGHRLGSGDAAGQVLLAWAAVLAPTLALAAIGLLGSVALGRSPTGLLLPVVAAFGMQLAQMLPLPVAVRLSLPGYAFISWNGLFSAPQQLGPLLIGIAVSLVWALAATGLARRLFLRRDFTNLADDTAGRRALTRGALPLAGLYAATVAVVAAGTGAGLTGSGIDQDKLQRSLATEFAHLYRLQSTQLHRGDIAESGLQAAASCTKGEGLVAAEGPGDDWRCTVTWHLPGVAATGSSVYQLDVNASGRYVADGDGPKDVNGYYLVHTPDGDEPNPLWQFDGNVDLLPSH